MQKKTQAFYCSHLSEWQEVPPDDPTLAAEDLHRHISTCLHQPCTRQELCVTLMYRLIQARGHAVSRRRAQGFVDEPQAEQLSKCCTLDVRRICSAKLTFQSFLYTVSCSKAFYFHKKLVVDHRQRYLHTTETEGFGDKNHTVSWLTQANSKHCNRKRLV